MSFFVAEANQAALLRRTGNKNPNASINNSHTIKQERNNGDGIKKEMKISKQQEFTPSGSQVSKTPSRKSRIWLYFIAVFLPFLPVLLRRGCGADLLINICLDLLGWIPGVGGSFISLKSILEVWAEHMGNRRIQVEHVKRRVEVAG